MWPEVRFHAGDEGRLPEHLWLEDERRKLFLGMEDPGSTSIYPFFKGKTGETIGESISVGCIRNQQIQ